ncbi:restriction endonuclease subunit S [Staphylococcus epidermidis]|nr:restriction endonuclease subunit S [Staphylococcus epidermidis]MCG2028454.1 restriction endonuclease subunit S [Staphylococcus epidermidis]MCG2276429.1 restriction endonuclease subunit S [Staphylococcus epidermidis]
MAGKKLVPKRRFKEFQNEEEWKQSHMKEVANVYDGTHQTPKYTKNGVMFLSVENIHSLKSNKYISYEDFERDFKIFPEKGDVLMTRIGDIGTANVVETDDEKAYYVTLTLLKKRGLNPYFLKESIHSVSIRKELWHRTLHIAFPKKINMDEIGKVLINYPGSLEQQKIGELFKVLDDRIANQEKKIAKVKALKTAYLTEMFPKEGETVPKRRFKGFEDGWRQSYLLDNIKKIIDFRGRTPKKLGLSWSENGYLALSALNVKNGYIDFTLESHYGDEELYYKWMSGNELNKDQVIFTTEAPMGNVAQVPDNKGYILSQRVIVFDCYEGRISNDFLAVLLRSNNIKKKLNDLSSGGTAKGVSQKTLESLKVKVPSLEEQKKIGEFFKNLNIQIEMEEKKLDKLQKMKEAYLEEMFV